MKRDASKLLANVLVGRLRPAKVVYPARIT
jgi:hypothetical protein